MNEDESEIETAGAEDDGSQEDRLDRVERKVDALVSTVEKLVPTHTQAQRQQETRLDRASSIADRVREELDRRDKVAADKRQADADQSERQTTQDRLAKLEEARPAPPVRRSTLIMWGDPRK
jgi:hypothetical protein